MKKQKTITTHLHLIEKSSCPAVSTFYDEVSERYYLYDSNDQFIGISVFIPECRDGLFAYRLINDNEKGHTIIYADTGKLFKFEKISKFMNPSIHLEYISVGAKTERQILLRMAKQKIKILTFRGVSKFRGVVFKKNRGSQGKIYISPPFRNENFEDCKYQIIYDLKDGKFYTPMDRGGRHLKEIK